MATTSGLAVNPASPSTMPAADLAKWTGFVDAPSQQRRKRRTAMAKQSTHGKRPRATFGCKHIKCDPTIRRAFERENLNIVKVCQLARKAGVVHFNPLLLDASDNPRVWALGGLDEGTRVEVWWTAENEWFAGRVVDHHANGRTGTTIFYDDGETDRKSVV